MSPFMDVSDPKRPQTRQIVAFQTASNWDTVSIMPGDLERLQRLAKAVQERRRAFQSHARRGTREWRSGRHYDGADRNPDAQTTEPRPTTLRRLDKGLQWPEGTAAKILHGGRLLVPALR